MNGKGSLTTGLALALMLGMGLTATVPAVGLRTAGAQDRTPAPAFDQSFLVNWTASPAALGESRISGYVYNNYGDDADQVQLRITEFDTSGRPIASFVKPLDETVPAFDQTYFDVVVPGQAASYRVAVESFTLLEGTK